MLAIPFESDSRLFQHLLDNLPNGTVNVFDRDGRYLFAAGRGLQQVNLSAEYLIGRRMADVFGPAAAAHVEPYYRQAFTGQTVTFDLVVAGRVYAINAGPLLYDGDEVAAIVAVAQEVTARHEAESALSQDHHLLETVSRNATLGLLMMDEHHYCTFMNPAAEQMTGYTLAEIQSDFRPLHAIIHHSHPDGTPYPISECPIYKALPTESRMQGEDYFVHRDGHYFPVAFTASPLVVNGRRTGTVIEVQDITARRAAEREHAALLVEAQTARQLAEAAAHSKNELIASITHDLRGPLTTIKGLAQLLRRQVRPGAPVTEQVIQGLHNIDAGTTRMALLIDELLDAARLEAGEPLALNPRPVDLVALAREQAALYQQTTERHSLSVECDVAELVGMWDGPRLERVFDNLLSNAIKYSPKGGAVTVSVRSEQDRNRRWAVLTVRDQGIGIPAAETPRIFERFYRAGNATAAIPGTGIGLAGVKQIVEQHHGEIALESEEGRGATVRVRLPL